jgi:uncharacterized RDD family membrane protein YckC
MNIRLLRWIFATVIATFLVLSFVYEIPAIGVSAEWTNNRYSYSGGTTPWAIASAFLVAVLYFLLMYASPSGTGQPLPGVFRRFVAFWLDFMLGMVAIAPFLGILPLIREWRRTGVFAWTFVRTTPAPGDTLQATVGVLCCSVALVCYFALPLIRRKPSPGTCILGYQVIPVEGTTVGLRTAVLRTLLGFIAVCAAYLAPFVSRDRKRGQFWLDKVFGTQAVRLS